MGFVISEFPLTKIRPSGDKIPVCCKVLSQQRYYLKILIYLDRANTPAMNMTREEMLAAFNKMTANTLMETLEIKYIDVDPEEGYLKVSMPVNSRVHQPAGLLHGGASAAIAESVGSASSVMYANPEEYNVLGIQLSCNHLRSKREGMVYGTARILHRGRSTHLWEISITDEEDRLISHCKLTNMIVKKGCKEGTR